MAGRDACVTGDVHLSVIGNGKSATCKNGTAVLATDIIGNRDSSAIITDSDGTSLLQTVQCTPGRACRIAADIDEPCIVGNIELCSSTYGYRTAGHARAAPREVDIAVSRYIENVVGWRQGGATIAGAIWNGQRNRLVTSYISAKRGVSFAQDIILSQHHG